MGQLLLVLLVGLLVIWAHELQAFAVSLVAVAAALVVLRVARGEPLSLHGDGAGEGKLHDGDLILMTGSGAGLAMGTVALEWRPSAKVTR